VAVLTVLERPHIGAYPNSLLDVALLTCLLVVALQLVPLAPSLRARVAPGAVTFDRTLRFAGVISPADVGDRPATLDAGATWVALSVGVSIALLFWNARAVFAQGGLRIVTRGIAWLGLALAPLTIVTHSTSPKLFYWHWQPYTSSAQPYGPFVNRNDLACWLVMAIPLTIGYIAARVESRRQSRNLAAAMDATALWLGASVCLMLAALLASLSRAGLAGIVVAIVCLVSLSGRSLTPRRVGGLALTFIVLLAIAGMYANLDELGTKVGAMSDGVGRRLIVWRFSWAMVRDFWPAGVGVGAYQDGILFYPKPLELTYINHAHSQYLQFIVEGGLFLIVPALVALVAGAWLMVSRLASDRTPVFWIRAGAVSGIVGLLVQSVWETTFRMPANAALFAVLAAVALHQAPASVVRPPKLADK
jgi:O-antigen ligase